MSTINIKPNGSFLVSVHMDNKRVRRSFKTKHEAELFLAELKVKALKGSSVGHMISLAACDVPKTVADLQKRVIEHVWKGSRGEKTATINSQCAVDFFGASTPLENEVFTPEQIDRYVTHLKQKGNSLGTINVKLSTLNRMISFANDRQWLSCMTKIRGNKLDKGRMRFLSNDEEHKLLEITYNLHEIAYLDLWTFLLDTGARVGEALAMRGKDIVIGEDRSQVTFWETKNGGFRTVPLTKRVVAILKQYLDLLPSDDSKIFPMKQCMVNYVWSKIKKSNPDWANDKEFVPHCLRHTCASRLVQRGIPLYTVMNFLGHKSMEMTARYSHLTSENLSDALRALEQPTTTHNNNTNE